MNSVYNFSQNLMRNRSNVCDERKEIKKRQPKYNIALYHLTLDDTINEFCIVFCDERISHCIL